MGIVLRILYLQSVHPSTVFSFVKPQQHFDGQSETNSRRKKNISLIYRTNGTIEKHVNDTVYEIAARGR